jgi:hypothetical protein
MVAGPMINQIPLASLACILIVFSEYTTFLSKAALQKILGKNSEHSIVEFYFISSGIVDFEVNEILEDYYIFAKENDITVKIRNVEELVIELYPYMGDKTWTKLVSIN